MSTVEFVQHLHSLGVVLTAAGGRLRCSAPKDALTGPLRAELARRKQEILSALTVCRDDTEPLVITPVPREAALPLAVPQERIWFLHQLNPRSSAYTIAPSVRVRGRLSMAAFQRAWDDLVARHEILRTRFPFVNGEPVQFIEPPSPVHIDEIDLCHLPDDERESIALQRAVEEIEKPFDLERGPVFRVVLLRLAAEDHLLVTAIHHIVSDQWSMGVMGRELMELYQARLGARSPRLPELPFQYGDYAYWHREWLNGPRLQGQLSYWKKQLAALKPQELPSDRPRGAGQSNLGARGTLLLPPALLRSLRRFGSEERASLFMVLMAAFKVVMARYTGQDDLAVGVPIANRTVTHVEGLIGTFVNTLVLRTDVSGNPSLREVLARVRQTALDAFANQDLSFERLVSELHLERDVNRPPLFQVLFNVQNAPVDPVRMADLDVTPTRLPRRSAQFDLTISIDTELEGRIGYAYNPALFDRETIEDLFRHFGTVLDQMVRDPEVHVASLDLMSVAERDKVLHTWNQTRRPLVPDETVVTLFARQVAERPDAVAVECNGERLTYRSLDERANRLASYLQARGAGPESLIGICLDRSVDLVVALLAVLKSGAAYLPLDPAFPAERLAFMVADSQARLLLTEKHLSHLLPASGASVICLGAGAAVEGDDDPVEVVEVVDVAPPVATSDRLAYVLYTSGSTGRPKGVQITHRSLTNFLQSMQREPGLSADDRVLSVTTLSFDIAGLELYLPLITGARLRLATRAEATDPATLAGAIEAGAITLMQATPATWRMLLDHGWKGREGLTILCGGEAMVRDLANRLLTRARAVWNMYGPTETTIWSTIERVTPGDDPVSIGRPIANTEMYVLDERLQPVPVGVPGELVIGGDGVARGYLNRPDLTAERFVPDPFTGRPGARLYRTGDLARFRRDGRLECLGRLDQQVKVRGFRIELGEIESVLAGHDSVTNAAVTLRRDRHGEATLVGYVVPVAGTEADMDGLRRHLRDRLPSYMVPSHLVAVDALPLTPNGKIDRAALPAPAPQLAAAADMSTASPVEKTIAGIWSDVLGVPVVGLDDDFFDLGGHSLLAVRLMARIETAFEKKIALATLFDARTVRQLAEVVQGRKAESRWVSLVPVQSEGTKPPFFCVHGVGGEVLAYSALAGHMAPDQPFVAFRASGYDGVSKPLHTIEEQAALYIREMTAYQPEGPYYIGGYSHGGRVALEMALQLEKIGKEVGFLGIMDTTPCPVRHGSLIYLARWLRNLPLWLWYDGRRTSRRGNLDRLRRARQAWRRRVLHSVRSRGVANGERQQTREIGEMMDVERLPEAIRRMYQLDYEAFIAYRPSAKCASVTVFRSQGQPLFGGHEPDLGWGKVTRGSVTVRHIAGNHSSILSEPVVQQLATKLRAALSEAQLVAEKKKQAIIRSTP